MVIPIAKRAKAGRFERLLRVTHLDGERDRSGRCYRFLVSALIGIFRCLSIVRSCSAGRPRVVK